jgi:hypothetical protein
MLERKGRIKVVGRDGKVDRVSRVGPVGASAVGVQATSDCVQSEAFAAIVEDGPAVAGVWVDGIFQQPGGRAVAWLLIQGPVDVGFVKEYA